jgi:plastocyanin
MGKRRFGWAQVNKLRCKQSAIVVMSNTAGFLLVLSLSLAATGCVSQQAPETAPQQTRNLAHGTQQVSMTIVDYKFAPSQIVASPGQKLHFVVTNKGKEEHGMDFDLPQGEVSMPSHLRAGETSQFDLTAPTETGTYHFHCPMGNHYAMGMDGDLVVK